MSINKILVHTQYYENYAHYEGGEHWKPKGGHTFQIEMDADLLLYTDHAEVLGKMVESQNSDLERFKYVDHEIQFHTPTVLGTCLLYTSPSPRDRTRSRMPSSA